MRRQSRPLSVRSSRPSSTHRPRGTPFSLSFFLLAVLHAVVYSLLVCESPAQAFLVREQANFEGFASIAVQTQQQLLVHAAIAAGAILYCTLAYTQRTQEAEAQQAQRATALHSVTQPPSLASLAGSVSGTHFLGVFAFLPASVGRGASKGKATADSAFRGAATFIAACV